MVDSYNIYRGQDGNIDYDIGVATMALVDTQVQVPDQDLPPETIWHYVRRQVRGDCGLEGESSNPCIIYIDAAGNMRPAIPNAPADLIAEPIAGGKICLRWRYGASGQEVAPDGFAVFQATSRNFSETPVGLVASGIAPNNEFIWYSDILTDGVYYYMVKAYSNAGGISQPSAIVTASPDGTGPSAITNMFAEVNE